MPSLHEEKQKLRRRWKNAFPQKADIRKALSARICQLISQTKAIKHANLIGLYAQREGEVNLTSLWQQFPKKCVFPKVTSNTLIFHAIQSLSELQPGYRQILEPIIDDPTRIARWSKGDILLVPGRVFDRWGGRIASGEGFYDRFLATLPPGIFKWGLCFAQQISKEKLAQEPTDVRMDALVCEEGINLVN